METVLEVRKPKISVDFDKNNIREAKNTHAIKRYKGLKTTSDNFLTLYIYKFDGKSLTIKCPPFEKISVLTDKINKLLLIEENQLVLEGLYHKNVELNSKIRLIDTKIKNCSVLFVKTSPLNPSNSLRKSRNVSIRTFGCVPRCAKVFNMLSCVKKGLQRKFSPELALDGTGGTYFMKNGRKSKCAVFKPFDEEPYAPYNPRIYRSPLGSSAFKPGLVSGSGANREVAAFVLDRNGFSGVPLTTIVELSNATRFFASRKSQADNGHKGSLIGSLQEMIKCIDTAGNYGTKLFDVEEVHKLAILDLRIVNLDRNEENILVNPRAEDKLLNFTPIDHGYCLPNCLAVKWCNWVWLSWPQTKRPMSQKSLEYIDSIDIDKDVESLRSLGIEQKSLEIFRLVNILLKKGARIGLSLFEIASLVLRTKKAQASKLETIMAQGITLTLNEKSLARPEKRQSLRRYSHFPCMDPEELAQVPFLQTKSVDLLETSEKTVNRKSIKSFEPKSVHPRQRKRQGEDSTAHVISPSVESGSAKNGKMEAGGAEGKDPRMRRTQSIGHKIKSRGKELYQKYLDQIKSLPFLSSRPKTKRNSSSSQGRGNASSAIELRRSFSTEFVGDKITWRSENCFRATERSVAPRRLNYHEEENLEIPEEHRERRWLENYFKLVDEKTFLLKVESLMNLVLAHAKARRKVSSEQKK